MVVFLRFCWCCFVYAEAVLIVAEVSLGFCWRWWGRGGGIFVVLMKVNGIMVSLWWYFDDAALALSEAVAK